MSQLELKSQVTTQMVFTFPTAALSGHTVGTAGLLFLPTTNRSTCRVRSPEQTRTEHKVNTDSKTQQRSFLWITTHVGFWNSTAQSTVFKYFRDTESSQQIMVSQHENNLQVCSLATDVQEMVVQKLHTRLRIFCHSLCKK